MDLMIVNGKGRRFAAEVDDHGRLYTRANVVSHMSHHATFHKNAYRCVFDTTLADGSEACVVHIKNTDQTKDVEIYYVTISADANIELNAKIGVIRTSGGTSVDAVNTNLSTSAEPTLSSYSGGASDDMVVSESDAKNLGGVFVGANQPHMQDQEGSIVVTPGKTFSFHVTGAAGNKVKIAIAFALHSEGTKL